MVIKDFIEVFKAAIQTNLGVISLIFLLVSIVLLKLFGISSDKIKLSAFTLILVSLGGIVYALILQPQPQPQPADSSNTSHKTTFVSWFIAAHTKNIKTDPTLPRYEAPNVPDSIAIYNLGNKCPSGHAATHVYSSIETAHPSRDVMYTVGANIENGNVLVSVRARENQVGYAYIKITAECTQKP